MEAPIVQVFFEGRVLQSIPFDRDLLRIGRRKDNDIVINNLSVSRAHANLRREGGRLLLEDLGSENGTLVNGERAGNAVLNPGDRIMIGKHQILIQMPAAAEPAAPAPEPTTEILSAHNHGDPGSSAADAAPAAPVLDDLEDASFPAMLTPPPRRRRAPLAPEPAAPQAPAPMPSMESAAPEPSAPSMSPLPSINPPAPSIAPEGVIEPEPEPSIEAPKPFMAEGPSLDESMRSAIDAAMENATVGELDDGAAGAQSAGHLLDDNAMSSEFDLSEFDLGMDSDPDQADHTDPVSHDVPVSLDLEADINAATMSVVPPAAAPAAPAPEPPQPTCLYPGLIVHRDGEFDRMVSWDQLELTAGRSPDCAIPLTQPKVSRRHATFVREGDQFEVRDLESVNFTFVNGEKIERRVLEPGDVVNIEEFELTFVLQSEPLTSTASPEPAPAGAPVERPFGAQPEASASGPHAAHDITAPAGSATMVSMPPEPSTPEPPMPAPSMPEPPMPEPSTPEPPMPAPSMPEPPMPAPSMPEPPMSAPSLPEPSMSAPSLSEPSAPEPPLPAPSMPDPGAVSLDVPAPSLEVPVDLGLDDDLSEPPEIETDEDASTAVEGLGMAPPPPSEVPAPAGPPIWSPEASQAPPPVEDDSPTDVSVLPPPPAANFEPLTSEFPDLGSSLCDEQVEGPLEPFYGEEDEDKDLIHTDEPLAGPAAMAEVATAQVPAPQPTAAVAPAERPRSVSLELRIRIDELPEALREALAAAESEGVGIPVELRLRSEDS